MPKRRHALRQHREDIRFFKVVVPGQVGDEGEAGADQERGAEGFRPERPETAV